VSKGSKIPALPPKSGCRVCGKAHFSLCPGCAEAIDLTPILITSPTCLRCGADRHGWGSAHLCLACDRQPAPARTPEQIRAWEEGMAAFEKECVDYRKQRVAFGSR